MAIKLKSNSGNLEFTKSGKIIRGVDGGYYIPTIDADGNLSWEATLTDMEDVAAVNIMGPEGKQGVPGKDGKDGEKGEQGIQGEKGEPGETPFEYGDTPPEDTTKIWITEDEEVEQIVYSNDVGRIVVVTDYPVVQEPDTLYLKIEG